MKKKWILFNFNNNSPKTVPHLDKEETKDAIVFTRYDLTTIAQNAYKYTFIYQ